MREDEVNVVPKKDVHLADLTPVGCLLVLVTIAAAFASVLLIVLSLPEEWVKRVPKAIFTVPMATAGVTVFWFGARVLGRFGFRVLRRHGEPKIVAISFGVVLCLVGVTLSLGALVLFFAKESLEAGVLLVGLGGALLTVAGFSLIRSAFTTQRAERRDAEQWLRLGNEVGRPRRRLASEAVDGREGPDLSTKPGAAGDRPPPPW
jgi:MFS family permease